MHRITVTFDRGRGKHHLSVEWAGWVLDLIGTSLQQEGAPEHWHWTNQPAPQCQSKAGRCKLAPNKHGGKIGCSSNLGDLSRHGGVETLGPSPEIAGKEDPTHLRLCSDPLTLSVRPLSSYQQQLLHSIQSLEGLGWTDQQIANHFNELGWLTPRGYRWIAQSVFSMRTKHEKRLARISNKR